MDTCVSLNQWDLAVDVAREHNISNVNELLAKYAAHLLEKGMFRKLEPERSLKSQLNLCNPQISIPTVAFDI